MAKLVLGIVGRMGSGKSTVTEYIKKKYGAASYRFSDPLRDILDRLHIEIERKNLQMLSTSIRTAFGDDTLSKTIAADAKEDTGAIVIIEGLRRPTDATFLKDIPGFRLIALLADQKTRYERITNRTENSDDAGKTFQKFQEEDSQESEQKIDAIAAEASLAIDNNGTIEALYQKIDALLLPYAA